MRISIVILNWNGQHMLEKYLPTVVRYSQGAEIIIADNASTDNSIEWLTKAYPDIRIIQLPQNYGFAGGYNRALKQIESEYYLLLNSDVEVTPNWLQPLLSEMDRRKDIVACQPKILSLLSRSHFEYAGASGGELDKYGYPFCRGRVFETVEQDLGQYDDEVEIFWATGACLMIRAEAFWAVGGFDERFFAHNEEIDLAWRLQLNGGRIYCFPKSSVYHLGGGTLPKTNPQKTFLNFRNNLTMLWKNLPEEELSKVMRIRFILDYLAAIQMLIFHWNVQDFKAVIKGRKAFKTWRKDFKRREIVSTKFNQKPRSMRKNYSVLWNYYVKRNKIYSKLK